MRAHGLRYPAMILFVAAIALTTEAQELDFKLESVNLRGMGIAGPTLRSGFTSAQGIGGGADFQFRIADGLFVSIGFGYGKVDVEENDPITNWNWAYWIKYYRNYTVLWLGSDSAYFNGQLVTLRAISNTQLTAGKYTGHDSVYSVELRPRQYMNSYPLTISIGGRYAVAEGIEVTGAVTGSVLFFERNFYLDETWGKRKKVDSGPDSGKYTYFTYDFRNFAPSKPGQALGMGGTVGIDARLLKGFSVYVSGMYQLYTASYRPQDYAILPSEDQFMLQAGVRVEY